MHDDARDPRQPGAPVSLPASNHSRSVPKPDRPSMSEPRPVRPSMAHHDMSESPLRQLVDGSGGTAYISLKSLQQARQDPYGIAVFEGDDGGEIYIVCPASLIQCSEDELWNLLQDIDEIEWPNNDPDMRRIYFESRPRGLPIPGGMGGAMVLADAWIHPRLLQRGYGKPIREVLGGRIERLQ